MGQVGMWVKGCWEHAALSGRWLGVHRTCGWLMMCNNLPRIISFS